MQIVNGHQRSCGATLLGKISMIQEDLVQHQDFGQAVRGVRALADDIPSTKFRGMMEELENDYNLMCSFMLKGYKDSQRPALYKRLVRRLATLLRNMETDVKRTDNAFFSSISGEARTVELDCSAIENHLVKHVQDVAMLSLDDDSSREMHSNALYDAHFAYMRNLFNAIVISHQWTEELAQGLANQLVSPTIDVIDAQTVVSAITLATLTTPDPQKVIALVETYVTAEDELVRQRALVGWVFAVGQADYSLFPEVEERIVALLDDETVRKDILQLEKQVILCQNATQDQETLRKDILPTIMKNQEFEMTRFGIKEKEESALEDILHPDADDRKMEQLEKSFRKISDMQKGGADIYFGGFSQMKRFSFFYTLCNWFTPFYIEHPQLRHLSSQLRNSGFVRGLTSKGPFCNSDKYSFALAISSVFANLPDNIKEMMERGEMLGGMAEEDDPTRTRAFVRRSYLQDLYRFFKLCDDRKKFSNPFDDRNNKMLLGVLARNKMLAEVRNLEVFLLKQKKFEALSDILATHFDQENLDDLRMQALVASHFKNYGKAEQTYRHIVKQLPDDMQALRGLGQALFHQGKYADAAQCYATLLDLQSFNKNYALFMAISQINNGEAEKAIQLLFKLHYVSPEDLNVKRAMAWAELWRKNLVQAHKLYEDILKDDKHVAADSLNAGYCYFFEGEVEMAVKTLAEGFGMQQLRKGQDNSVGENVELDQALFDRYDIPKVDRLILSDLVNQYAKTTDA